MAGLPVVAGPLDGAQCKALGGKYVFLVADPADAKKAIPSRTPSPGSHVYERESTRFRFAGHAHRVCRCGAHIKPHEGIAKALNACPLCGHELR